MKMANKTSKHLIRELRTANQQLQASNLALQKKTYKLDEHVKELNCLYALSKIIEKPNISLDEILQETVNLIPASWQYPEITCARITLDGREFKTRNCRKTRWRQISAITVCGKRRGAMQVCYQKKRPKGHEGPFLKEERSLLDDIAERLGRIIERISLTEALEQSEQKFRLAFENSKDAIFWGDTQTGLIINCNKAAETLLEKTKKEIIAQPTTMLHPPEKAEYYRKQFQRHVRKKGSVDDEAEIITKSGKIKPVRISASKTSIGRGSVIQGIFCEITEQKKAEKALKESEQRFRAIFEQARDGYVLTDENGKILEFNDAAHNHLGYTRHEFGQLTIADIDVDKDATAVRKLARQFSAKGKFSFEARHRAKNGEIRNVHVSGRVIELADRQVLSVILRDITEQKKAEDALKESEENYRLLFETSRDAIITITPPSWNFTSGNHAALKLFGVKDKETFFTAPPWKYSPEYQPDGQSSANKAKKMISTAMEKGSHFFEWTHKKLNGEEFFASVLLTRMSIGEKTFLQGTVRDITESKHIENELRKMQKLESIGTLAGGIAHDFNNMLCAALAYTNLAQSYIADKGEALRHLAGIEKIIGETILLTNKLLTFSKGGAPVKKPISLPELIRESTDFALAGSNVRSEFRLEEDLLFANADKGQLGQVIQNLVINAAHAMPNGGMVTVSAENVPLKKGNKFVLDEGQYVKINVKDNGIGIPEKYLKNIFDPFFTTKPTGHGLGLSTAYSIIRNHQGSITIDSEPGVGTTVEIYLPACRKQALKEKAPKKALVSGEGKILVMDDEEFIRKSMGSLLTRMGYEVLTAKDGAEAIALYKSALASSSPVNVVIMDLTIRGGRGGRETIEQFLKIDPDVKAIVASGYSNDDVMANYAKYGFKGCLAKPCNASTLNATISKLIGKKKRS